jgi:putative flippase GtrA
MPTQRTETEGPSTSLPGPAGRPGPAHRLGAPALVQFVKFGIVGMSNTLLTFIVYTLLLKVFGVWYLAASAIGWVVGATNGFLWNRRWTFRGHIGDALTPVRWAVVQGCGLILNLGLIYMFVSGAGLGKILAQACSIAIVTVLTFLVNRAWTFRTHSPVPVAPRPSVGGDG